MKWLGLKGHFAESSAPASVDLYFFDGGYCGVQPVDISDGVERVGRVNALCHGARRCGQHTGGGFPFAILRCENAVVDGSRLAIR